jgi:hypothetical protein
MPRNLKRMIVRINDWSRPQPEKPLPVFPPRYREPWYLRCPAENHFRRRARVTAHIGTAGLFPATRAAREAAIYAALRDAEEGPAPDADELALGQALVNFGRGSG